MRADRPGPSLWQQPSLDGAGEDRFLSEVFAVLPGGEDVVVGPGDDAAVIAGSADLVVTTDTMVLGRDWLDEWSSAADVGEKVVVANLSDIEAMGARPTGIVVTLVADPTISREWALELSRSIGDACRRWRVPVLGGDLSSAAAGVVVVSITAMGTLDGRPAVRRDGARTGDVVAVAGRLGYAAAGLELLQRDRGAAGTERHGTEGAADASGGDGAAADAGAGGEAAADVTEAEAITAEAIAAQRRPTLQHGRGAEAAAAGASAMLDISDGLVRDAGRVARASGVTIDLDADAIGAAVAELQPALGRDAAERAVLAGGEEHSLLATFTGAPPQGWRVIGRVVEAGDEPAPARVTLGGIPPTAQGWDHFGG